MNRLQDKVAIVTGGAGGIGSATVDRLIAEGAKGVVVADIAIDNAQKVAARYGNRAVAFEHEGADEKSSKRMVELALERFGRIDVLHNNHALLTKGMPDDTTVVDTPFEVWDETMAINLRGYFAAAKYAIPHMIRVGGGSVINMTSDSGIKSDHTHIAYGVSKAGVSMLTKSIATHHGKDGIRCNGIAPGLVVHASVRVAAGQLVDILDRHTPSKALGVPEDVAALVAYLAADEARFINGQIISCDGGLLAHMPQVYDLEQWLKTQSA
jgi:NAD(P)-dependent dehydrogenase (short-subunit alcohol dehydrogenase family)